MMNLVLWILMLPFLSSISNRQVLPNCLFLNIFSREGNMKQYGLAVPLTCSPTFSVHSPTGPLSGSRGPSETNAWGVQMPRKQFL